METYSIKNATIDGTISQKVSLELLLNTSATRIKENIPEPVKYSECPCPCENSVANALCYVAFSPIF